MRIALFTAVLLALPLFVATPAQGKVIIPNANQNGVGAGWIQTFPDGATGNVHPVSGIVPGQVNPIVSASAVEYEPVENVLYVADFWGQAVRVYDASGNGGVAPLRTLKSLSLGQARIARVDRVRDELVAIAGMTRICTWPRLANGEDVAPTRCIPWGASSGSASQLNNPGGLALNRARREIVVGDYSSAQPYTNRILVFARSADANASAPLRVIEGPNTQLGSGTNVRVIVDEQRQFIIALAGTRHDDSTTSARILVFAADASGDAAPIRAVQGALAGLELSPGEYPTGLGYDEVNQMSLAAIGTNNPAGQGRVIAHWEFAQGDALPIYTLTGSQTGIGSVPGSPTATSDRLFRDGFD
ncbi:MAG: hypothetical protein K8F35_12890 [Dokdonella sp.]|uniref:hypothetical protein n=1 Tax=Dokdonella sp. TaxID=2291710 RepID=UPI0025B9BD92|nr:hypothetical protein [Dokdonella sp.]MBZ0223913.1 hypothetical protein [Dokdonella sp.]